MSNLGCYNGLSIFKDLRKSQPSNPPINSINMTTFHTKGQLHPNTNSKEQQKKLHEAAAKYANLKPDFDKFNISVIKFVRYQSYIAGYVAALTTPVTNTGETNQFDETEAYLEEQL